MTTYNPLTQPLPPEYSVTTSNLQTAIDPVKEFVILGVDRKSNEMGAIQPVTAMELSARANAESIKVLRGMGGNRDLFVAPTPLTNDFGFAR